MEKLNWRLINYMFVLAMVTTLFASCDDTLGGDDPAPESEMIELSGNITSNITLEASKKYLLKGNVFVLDGAELTIQPGTVVFGDKLTKGSLVIERGAKIHATGTAEKPIVFTSSAPVGFRNYGDWGGVVILGRAVNNQSENQNIEGITAGANGQYGGTNDDDNSGELQYVRIEFGGIALSTDNELNGLTLASVGSGTKIDHIQVSYSGDDSFEWFGGTVNAQYLVAYKSWDDDFDVDFGYRGNVQYAVSFRDPNIADKSGSNGFEADNDGSGSTKTPKTAAAFSNVTWFGPHVYSPLSNNALNRSAVSANYQFAVHLRRNTDIQIYNSVFLGSQLEAVHFDRAGAALIFKGNYIGRYGINASTAGTVKRTTTGNNYNDANFAAENMIEASGLTVDLSAKFSGLSGTMDLNAPSALLSSGSSLLSGAATVPGGLTQTTYIGAFDASNNWLSGWTTFDPNTSEY